MVGEGKLHATKTPSHDSNQGCCNYMVCISSTWLPARPNVAVKQSRKVTLKVHVVVICELNRNRFSSVPLPINLQKEWAIIIHFNSHSRTNWRYFSTWVFQLHVTCYFYSITVQQGIFIMYLLHHIYQLAIVYSYRFSQNTTL